MNVELICALARIRRDELLAQALVYRLLQTATPPRRRGARTTLVRAVRAVGHAALSLGDALAGSR